MQKRFIVIELIRPMVINLNFSYFHYLPRKPHIVFGCGYYLGLYILGNSYKENNTTGTNHTDYTYYEELFKFVEREETVYRIWDSIAN